MDNGTACTVICQALERERQQQTDDFWGTPVTRFDPGTSKDPPDPLHRGLAVPVSHSRLGCARSLPEAHRDDLGFERATPLDMLLFAPHHHHKSHKQHDPSPAHRGARMETAALGMEGEHESLCDQEQLSVSRFLPSVPLARVSAPRAELLDGDSRMLSIQEKLPSAMHGHRSGHLGVNAETSLGPGAGLSCAMRLRSVSSNANGSDESRARSHGSNADYAGKVPDQMSPSQAGGPKGQPAAVRGRSGLSDVGAGQMTSPRVRSNLECAPDAGGERTASPRVLETKPLSRSASQEKLAHTSSRSPMDAGEAVVEATQRKASRQLLVRAASVLCALPCPVDLPSGDDVDAEVICAQFPHFVTQLYAAECRAPIARREAGCRRE